MARNPALESLIRSLKDADSAFERMHALGLAWRGIRSLRPAERKTLARHAGFDGAEELIERLALHKGGIAPAILLQAIQEARQSRPQRLKSIFASLRNPKTRGATLLSALDAVVGRMSGSEEEEAEADPTGREKVLAGETGEGTTDGLEHIPEDLQPLFVESAEDEPKDEVDTAASRAVPQEDKAPPTELEQGAHDDSASIAATLSPADGAPSLQRSPHPAEAHTDSTARMDEEAKALPEPEREIEKRGHGSTVSRAEVLNQIQQAPTLIGKFRAFSGQDAGVLSNEELHDILEDFPPGWARRRALQLLIRGNRISDSALALEFCRELSGRHNQNWIRHEIEAKWNLKLPATQCREN